MLFAIGDLHLGRALAKPMNIFGQNWDNHEHRIEKNWRETVGELDSVIICGDVSWAMTMEEFLPDLKFIKKLPGKKIILSGNHDFWWGSTEKLNSLDQDIFFLKNNFFKTEDNTYICGARGWLCPNDTEFTPHDEKIYTRDALRLKLSLDAAIKDGAKEIIAAMHFPPKNDRNENSLFTETLKQYPVKKLVYGHLHGKKGFERRPDKADIRPEGIEYLLVSADYVDFTPVRIR